ncbi:hypothetical protein EDD11_009333 [Mortierella claussenii]|nr:hypothetical protein EDD11_009333 [Mortierella claussenii]
MALMGLSIAVFSIIYITQTVSPSAFWVYQFVAECIAVTWVIATIIQLGYAFYPLTRHQTLIWRTALGSVILYDLVAVSELSYYCYMIWGSHVVHPDMFPAIELYWVRQLVKVFACVVTVAYLFVPLVRHHHSTGVAMIADSNTLAVGTWYLSALGITSLGYMCMLIYYMTRYKDIFRPEGQALDLCIRLTPCPIFSLPPPPFLIKYFQKKYGSATRDDHHPHTMIEEGITNDPRPRRPPMLVSHPTSYSSRRDSTYAIDPPGYRFQDQSHYNGRRASFGNSGGGEHQPLSSLSPYATRGRELAEMSRNQSRPEGVEREEGISGEARDRGEDVVKYIDEEFRVGTTSSLETKTAMEADPVKSSPGIKPLSTTSSLATQEEGGDTLAEVHMQVQTQTPATSTTTTAANIDVDEKVNEHSVSTLAISVSPPSGPAHPPTVAQGHQRQQQQITPILSFAAGLTPDRGEEEETAEAARKISRRLTMEGRKDGLDIFNLGGLMKWPHRPNSAVPSPRSDTPTAALSNMDAGVGAGTGPGLRKSSSSSVLASSVNFFRPNRHPVDIWEQNGSMPPHPPSGLRNQLNSHHPSNSNNSSGRKLSIIIDDSIVQDDQDQVSELSSSRQSQEHLHLHLPEHHELPQHYPDRMSTSTQRNTQLHHDSGAEGHNIHIDISAHINTNTIILGPPNLHQGYGLVDSEQTFSFSGGRHQHHHSHPHHNSRSSPIHRKLSMDNIRKMSRDVVTRLQENGLGAALSITATTGPLSPTRHGRSNSRTLPAAFHGVEIGAANSNKTTTEGIVGHALEQVMTTRSEPLPYFGST